MISKAVQSTFRTNFRALPFVLACLFTAALPTLAHAELDEPVRNALRLAETGSGQQALSILLPMEVDRAGNPDFDTVLGIAANQAADYTKAIFALERVLIVQPTNARAKAELARALFAVGDRQAARALLQQTKDQGIPVEAAASIDDFLQAIDRVDADAKSSYRSFVELGVGHDTNVTSGIASSSVAVPLFGGALFPLGAGGVKLSSNFATLGGGIAGRYIVDSRWSIIGSATGQVRGNSGSGHEYNTDQENLSLGASYRYERNEYTVAGVLESYGVSGSRLREQAGVVGEWAYKFDAFRQFGAYVQASRLFYPTGATNVNRYVVGASYAHQFRSSGWLLFGGAYVGREDPRDNSLQHLGQHLVGVRTGLQKPINDSLALFASASYEHRERDAVDPLFLVTRGDNQINLNIGLTWVPAKTWRVTPQINIIRTNSNVAIADYDRNMFSVTVRKDF